MNKPEGLTRFMQCFVVAIAANAAGCKARDVPTDWRAECAGRMQLSFPTEIDVAAATQKDLQRYADPPSSSFVDNQSAPWSDLGYLGGIRVIHGFKPIEIEQFLVNRQAAREKFRRDAEQAERLGKGFHAYQELVVTPQNGFGFQAQNEQFLVLKLGQHVFTWSGYSGTGQQEAQLAYNSIINGLRPRDEFAIPAEPGVCLPYAFIRDEGKTRRYIATTYRLREHPDVTILLKDVTAAIADPKANQAVYDPESISNSFWSLYDSSYRKSLRSVWSTPYKKTILANSEGVESFVKIVRNDDAVDYGYLVAARGDPEAKEDTPDLMLYVIQDSKNAKAKGIIPMEKDAFLEMAQTIAASVKRRPVEPR